MDSGRWKRIQKLFDAAADMAAGERATWLERECAGDPLLRRQVESLILASEEEDGAIGRVIGDVARAAQTEVPDPEGFVEGERLGPYRLVRPLGRGGMGEVFLAVRADDEFHKEVAIKVVRAGVSGDEILKRFRSERQILAALDHPNIARLLDGGTTERGEPFVVMEYVDGEPIDRYCDSRGLTTAERIELFRTVCDAVQYAHRNLVVHRDIKPANVLVTAEGVPKLLDFGIAKILDAGPGVQTVAVTSTGVRLLTPEYASPEQVRGETITTATDVYSLGVLLYELLTGRRPFRFENRLAREIERIVCEVQPERPSTAVSSATRRSTDGTRSGPRDSMRLQRELAGDLDNIVLMALRKEPERRYASAERFAEDLGRHLEGLPVLACEDTWSYRCGKFVRRHRAGVGVTAGAVILLAAFAVTMAVQSSRLARERDRAIEAEAKARRESATANRVTDFMIELFDVSTPGEARDREITAREVLDRGAARIESELQDEPEIRARLLDVMGRVYGTMNVNDQARPLIEEGLRLRREVFGEEHLEVAESLHNMGAMMYVLGEFDEAERYYREAIEMRKRMLGEDDALVGSSIGALAAVYHYRGELEKAEELYRESRDILERAYGDEHPEVVRATGKMASIAMARGRAEDAEALYRTTLEMSRRVFGEDHLSTADAMSDLAILLKNREAYDEAEPLYRAVLDIRRRAFDGDSTTVAQAINNLAVFLRAKGDYEQAEPLYHEALAMYTRVLGEKHPNVALSINNLAAFYSDRGDLERAEKLYRRSIEIYTDTMGPDYWVTRQVRFNLGKLFLKQGLEVEAEKEMVAAYEGLRAALGPEHRRTRHVATKLAELYVSQGRTDEAEALASRDTETP